MILQGSTYLQQESGSENEYDVLNIDLILENNLILQAYQNLKNKNYDESLQKFQEALEISINQNNFDQQALIRCCIGLIQFQCANYQKSIDTLEQAFMDLKKAEVIKQDTRQQLFLKIFGNLTILYILKNDYEKSKQYNENSIELILQSNQDTQKKQYFEEIMFNYYRFETFQQMGSGYVENAEIKYDGGTLACFYNTMGLNRELQNDNQTAYFYYQKSLDIWKELNEKAFILITLKHMIYLSQQMHLDFDQIQNYKSEMSHYLNSDEFRGVNPESLFKDFEKKLNTAKDITFSLQKIEEQLYAGTLYVNEVQQQDQEKLDQDAKQQNYIQFIQKANIFGEPLWQQAVRLRLCNSIRYSQELINNSFMNHNQKKALNEKDQGMLKDLKQNSFTKESLNIMNTSIQKIVQFIQFINLSEGMKRIQEFMDIIRRDKIQNQQRLKLNKIKNNAINKAKSGDYLLKCNKNSDGSHFKFFKVEDSILKWATEEKNIKNQSKVQFYKFQDVKSVFYGKISEVFLKKCNKKLENHLCLSLILKTRTLDIYCEEDQINDWFIALSCQTKKYNPTAYILMPGKYFWRKIKYKLEEKYQSLNKNTSKNFSFCKLILIAKKKGLIF